MRNCLRNSKDIFIRHGGIQWQGNFSSGNIFSVGQGIFCFAIAICRKSMNGWIVDAGLNSL